MSRIRSRLNSLERNRGPVGSCPVCMGDPPGGSVVVQIHADGSRSEPDGTPACRGCGERGPTLWLTIDHREFPLAPKP